MKENMIKGVIFDFDGTLTELTLDFGHLRTEIEKVAQQYVGDEDIKSQENQYIIEMIYGVECRLGEKADTFRHEAFARLRELEMEASRGKDVYPYTRDVLRRLREKGIKIGVITRSHVDVLTLVFRDIESYVETIVTRDEVREVKPHPNHGAEVLRLLGITPEEAILVGDHPTDVLAGKAVGMQTAGVLSGRTTREAFEKVGATYILEDIRGIPELL
jgi:phosphoglycolate phosphatase